MTPEELEGVRQELAAYAAGTLEEWCRSMVVEVEDHPLEGVELHVRWEGVTDGAMIANVSETLYRDPIARFGVQITVETLPEPEPEWVETVMSNCLAGDRIRIGAEETIVLFSSVGVWHADTRDEWRPKSWQHTELRLELEAVPVRQQYPPNASIEILADAIRRAAMLLHDVFPGTKPVDS